MEVGNDKGIGRLPSTTAPSLDKILGQQATRIRELEDQLHRCHEDYGREQTRRREPHERQPRTRAEAASMHTELHGKLEDIHNLVQTHADTEARRQTLEEGRLAAKEARRVEKLKQQKEIDERLNHLRWLVDGMVEDRDDEKRRRGAKQQAAMVDNAELCASQ